MIEEITKAMREIIVRHAIQNKEEKPGVRLLEEAIGNAVRKMLLKLSRKKHFFHNGRYVKRACRSKKHQKDLTLTR